MFKLGVDSGRGTLKAYTSLLYATDDLFQPKKKEVLEGVYPAKNFKDNEVKKTLLLGVSAITFEDYDSVQNFLKPLKLPSGKFVLCADLKIIHCALGLMAHSASYCHWVTDDLNV